MKTNDENSKTELIIASKEEVTLELEKLLKADKLLIRKLVNYAANLLKLKKNIVLVIEPTDIVNETITKILEGKRHWNKTKYPDLLDFIKVAIQSELNNAINAKLTNNKNLGKKHRFVSIYNETEDGEIVEIQIEDTSENILEVLSIDQFIETLQKLLEDNEDLEAMLVLDEILLGYTNKEISEKLNIPIDQVENAKKRIKRSGKKLLNDGGFKK
jgi:DNA-directed RNA polymerase specialized sigma24 family protein